MSLSASALKEIIKSITQGQTQAVSVLPLLGNAIATYIMDNAVVNFSWNGIDPVGPAPPPPVPTPDPVVTATGKILDVVITLTPSYSNLQAGAFVHLQNEIIAGVSAATYNVTDSGFSLSPGSMSTSPTIASLVLSVSGNNRDGALLQFATCIVNWVKSQVPAQILLGSHGVYLAPTGTGAAVINIE